MFNPLRSSSLVVLVWLTLSGATARADELNLPNAPGAWINSPPLTTEMLAGKTAYLYYFEESCPSCRAHWPRMLEAAKQFSGKPIVFIGVNSGTPRNEVQQYLQEVGVAWPVVVDLDRSIEKASNVGEISLNNIYQAKLLMPDGSLQGADVNNLAASANVGLAEAKWRVDPAVVPTALKPAWLQVEFGNFAAAAPLIKRNLNAPNVEIKAAAEKLQAAVDAEFKKELTSALPTAFAASSDAATKWTTYKKLSAVAARFPGFELPTDAAALLQQLTTDESIKNEAAAMKQWEAAQRTLSAGTPAARRIVQSQLQRIVTQFAGTEAAGLAQAALDRMNAAAP